MHNTRNLKRLAKYLQSLPEDYREFDMTNFYDGPDERHYALFNGRSCGTVACAVGHGPSAGLFFRRDEISWHMGPRWVTYTDRVFTSDDDAFQFLFGEEWADVDNHHWGAAARIRCFLENGVPDDFYNPDIYDCYRIDECVPLPKNFYTKAMLARFEQGRKSHEPTASL